MREFLKGLELDKETIDTIMAEHGKLITESKEEINSLKSKVKDYESQIDELNKNASDNTKIQEELTSLKNKIAEDKKKVEIEEKDKILTTNIIEAIGETEFVNERTKKSIINEIKEALQDKANVGKSAKDLFNDITKDSTDIIKNPNQISNDMPEIKNVSVDGNANNGLELNPIFKSYN